MLMCVRVRHQIGPGQVSQVMACGCNPTESNAMIAR